MTKQKICKIDNILFWVFPNQRTTAIYIVHTDFEHCFNEIIFGCRCMLLFSFVCSKASKRLKFVYRGWRRIDIGSAYCFIHLTLAFSLFFSFNFLFITHIDQNVVKLKPACVQGICYFLSFCTWTYLLCMNSRFHLFSSHPFHSIILFVDRQGYDALQMFRFNRNLLQNQKRQKTIWLKLLLNRLQSTECLQLFYIRARVPQCAYFAMPSSCNSSSSSTESSSSEPCRDPCGVVWRLDDGLGGALYGRG